MRTLKLPLKLPLLGAICALATVAGGCKDEEPVPLFDEQGTWALFLFDLEGSGLEPFDVPQREDKFMIYFDQESQIVASAACLDSMMSTDITGSLCDTGKYQCRCFNYEFTEAQMRWTEFTPEGGTPPPAPPEDSAAPKPGEAYSIELEAYPDSNSTYRFSRLPYGLFNSDGESTKYVFQGRSDAQFLETGCNDYCGIAAAEPAEGG